jgi:hypothetical protein
MRSLLHLCGFLCPWISGISLNSSAEIVQEVRIWHLSNDTSRPGPKEANLKESALTSGCRLDKTNNSLPKHTRITQTGQQAFLLRLTVHGYWQLSSWSLLPHKPSCWSGLHFLGQKKPLSKNRCQNKPAQYCFFLVLLDVFPAQNMLQCISP